MSTGVVGYQQVIPSKTKWLNGIGFINMANPEGFNLQDLKPTSGGEATDDQFLTWWWNNDSTKGVIGNNEAIWNSFYYLGDSGELPIRPGDEDLEEDGYIWLDEDDPSTWVWTDKKDVDFPIRYTDIVFPLGAGFFCQPTCEDPGITIAGLVLKPVENVAYYPLVFTKTKTMLANPFPVEVNFGDIIPCSKGEVTDDQFLTWWWNNDTSKGDIGNNEAMWNSFYYLGDSEELPIRVGDEDCYEDGYIWLDEDDPTTWVWTDKKDVDFPIRYADKIIRSGEGFFCQPTCEEPSFLFPNPFYTEEK